MPLLFLDYQGHLCGFSSFSERHIELGNTIFLHSGRNVRIQVERDTGLGVPEPFVGDLGMYGFLWPQRNLRDQLHLCLRLIADAKRAVTGSMARRRRL
jgi:hypothetical protein